MNVFSIYSGKIKNFLIDLEKNKKLKLPENLNNLIIELPPRDLKGDISCNAAMILSKANEQRPMELAKFLQVKLSKKFSEFKIVFDKIKKKGFKFHKCPYPLGNQKDLFYMKKFSEFNNIYIAKPGFLNIEFNDEFWKNFVNNLLNLNEKYGASISTKKKYNIEFVSANPTGPLHVGHCRGAILGDVIANLLIFNGNDVTREYYVNDYGNQVKNFTLSVFYRIIEILHNKKFPTNLDDLYPGEYVIDIAKKVIDKKIINEKSNFEDIYEKLKDLSTKEAIKLIKYNLSLLGIQHDHFVSESKLVKDKEVTKCQGYFFYQCVT